MMQTQGSLMARLAMLEHLHAPTLALVGEVRVFGPDGSRIDNGAPPPTPGRLRAIVDVHLGGLVAPDV